MIVEFQTNKNVLVREANHILSNDTLNTIKRNTRTLKDSFDTPHIKMEVDPQLRQEIIDHFWGFMASDLQAKLFFNSGRNVRRFLSLVTTEEQAFQIQVIANWDFTYTIIRRFKSLRQIPFIFNLLVEHFNTEYANNLFSYIRELLVDFNPNFISLQKYNKYIDLFDPGTGIAKSTDVVLNSEVPIIPFLDEIGLRHHLSSSYVSIFIISLLEEIRQTDKLLSYFDEIKDFANAHSKRDLKKIIYARLIEKIESNHLTDKKAEIKNEAIKNVGDPAIDSNWRILSYPMYEDEVKNGKRILNIWLNEYLIELFFGKIVMDRDRKNFWLEYKDKIPSIKICIPYHLKIRLSRDENLSSFLKGRIHTLNGGNGDESILLMQSKKYLFVESTVIGTAFYAYLLNGAHCPNIDTPYIYKSSLIKPVLPWLFRRSGYIMNNVKTEGRVAHIPPWQDFFHLWIKNNCEL
jgi:hypothetical protein